MRIGIDIRHLTDPKPAGVGGYTKHLLDALFRLDQENEYVLFATGTPRALRRLPKFHGPNIHLKKVAWPNKLVNLFVWLTGRPIFDNVDVWLFPNLNFIATKKPYAVMAHDLSYKVFPEFFTLKSQLWHKAVRSTRIFKNATAIVCPSTSTKQDLVHFYNIDESKIHVTPLAASLAGAEAPANTLPKNFILSLATLEPRKNHTSIIEAYEAYRDMTEDHIHLVIGGGRGWKSTPIIRAAKKSKYAKDIHLLGYVGVGQKAELYRRARVFVFPSFYEGFGLPVLEAMSLGCPVITSHTSSLPELVGDAGLLVDPYNVNDITMAMKLVLTSDRLRQDLITKGLCRAQHFSWEQTAKKTLDVLLALSHGREIM